MPFKCIKLYFFSRKKIYKKNNFQIRYPKHLNFIFGFIYVISVLFLLYFRACLFIDALWSPAGKGLTSWLLFVVSNCEFATFPLVSWVRCGA